MFYQSPRAVYIKKRREEKCLGAQEKYKFVVVVVTRQQKSTTNQERDDSIARCKKKNQARKESVQVKLVCVDRVHEGCKKNNNKKILGERNGETSRGKANFWSN